MGVLSFLKRKNGGSAPAPADAALDSVEQARTRARRRLIGALVLLSIGVIGFPLLFESQPRPIPVDIPIDIPAKEGAAPLPMPGPRVNANSAASAAMARRAEPMPEVITETRADAGRDVTPAELPTAASASSPKSSEKPVPKPASFGAEAARAQALLDGKSAPPPAASAPGVARFIVQVGAFADPQAARETRLKVEKLGLKTYTQIADTPAGKRIRVRVGPFASRAEVDKAIARVRAAGVAATVLTL